MIVPAQFADFELSDDQQTFAQRAMAPHAVQRDAEGICRVRSLAKRASWVLASCIHRNCLERLVRDRRVQQFLERTHEIMRVIIVRRLLRAGTMQAIG